MRILSGVVRSFIIPKYVEPGGVLVVGSPVIHAPNEAVDDEKNREHQPVAGFDAIGQQKKEQEDSSSHLGLLVLRITGVSIILFYNIKMIKF